jgi:hypothetical protein
MKKVLMGLVMILALCAPAFGQVKGVATETLKAYQARDAETLKKHVAGFFKTLINDSYFDKSEVQKHLKALEKWDGTFKEIRYASGDIAGKQMYTAMAYYADAPDKNEIFAVALASLDNKTWTLVGDGLVQETKVEFEKFGNLIASQQEKAVDNSSKKFSIEMANGDKFEDVSAEKIKENIDKLNDDNFFIILNDGENFLQAAYSEKGFDLQYKESGAQFTARDYLTKEQAVKTFLSYYKSEDGWKDITPWDKQ